MVPARHLLYRTHLSEAVWRRAVESMASNQACTASLLRREVKLGSYRTAWRVARIIRTAMGRVEWPKLEGEVQLGEHGVSSGDRTSVRILVAEVTSGHHVGLIRASVADRIFSRTVTWVIDQLHPGAHLVTPLGPYAPALRNRTGIAVRPSKGTDAFAAVSTTVQQFRQHLLQRNHRGIAPVSVENYLLEYVFHRNATVLGWNAARRSAEVWRTLSTAEDT